MSYLAIDPGRDTGWALYEGYQRLVACGLSDPRYVTFPLPVRTVIIEKPKVYIARMSKGDPNDLITLALQVGEYKDRFSFTHKARVALVLPQDWKGQLSKEVTQARLERSLATSERQVIAEAMRKVVSSKQHNVWDAIALGRAAFEQRLWA